MALSEGSLSMSSHDRRHGVRTRAIHAGHAHDPVTGASAPNLVLASTFVLPPDWVRQHATRSFGTLQDDESAMYVYARESNPTVRQLEQKIAALEDGEASVAFASGMAAASSLLFHTLTAGDHLVATDVSYVGVAGLVRDTLPRFGIEVSLVDMTQPDEVAAAMRPNTRMVWIETPVNPILELTDIAEICRVAHAAGARVAVDSTWATPIATRPRELGADFVMHSLTKYICGHGDAMGGIVVGAADVMQDLATDVRVHVGGVLSPASAYLIARGADTLPIRMAAHAEGALAVATTLERHPAVRRVRYPGLPSHPQHELAKRQMANFSGMLAFRVDDGPALAAILAESARIFHYAVSLGHQRSLIVYVDTEEMQTGPLRLAPSALARYREFAGDGIFRVSVGLEDPEDLIAELTDCLDQVA
jgi:methionine-gamma-lyase